MIDKLSYETFDNILLKMESKDIVKLGKINKYFNYLLKNDYYMNKYINPYAINIFLFYKNMSFVNNEYNEMFITNQNRGIGGLRFNKQYGYCYIAFNYRHTIQCPIISPGSDIYLYTKIKNYKILTDSKQMYYKYKLPKNY
jgi:hypothetical protein